MKLASGGRPAGRPPLAKADRSSRGQASPKPWQSRSGCAKGRYKMRNAEEPGGHGSGNFLAEARAVSHTTAVTTASATAVLHRLLGASSTSAYRRGVADGPIRSPVPVWTLPRPGPAVQPLRPWPALLQPGMRRAGTAGAPPRGSRTLPAQLAWPYGPRRALATLARASGRSPGG